MNKMNQRGTSSSSCDVADASEEEPVLSGVGNAPDGIGACTANLSKRSATVRSVDLVCATKTTSHHTLSAASPSDGVLMRAQSKWPSCW